MNTGDPIWYRQTCRGGYGFQQDVPGQFLHLTRTRAVVTLFRKDGTPVKVVVHPKNVRPRDPAAVWR